MEFTKENQEELRENLTELLSWDINDSKLWKTARLCTRMYLMTKNIDYHMVKCDEENNLPIFVDQNLIVVDVYDKEYKYYTILI